MRGGAGCARRTPWSRRRRWRWSPSPRRCCRSRARSARSSQHPASCRYSIHYSTVCYITVSTVYYSTVQYSTCRLSIPSSSCLWWRSVPSLSTVPPNRLNCGPIRDEHSCHVTSRSQSQLTWTVILVVMAGSMMAASSWAAKILNGLFQKSSTEINCNHGLQQSALS